MVAEAIAAFSELRDSMEQTFAAMSALAARGDLAGAARVGMLQLELVYRSGTLAILRIWDDWGNALIDVIAHVNAECGKMLAEMGAAIRSMAVLVAFPMNAGMREPLLAAIEMGRRANVEALEAEEQMRKDARRGGTEGGLKRRTEELKVAQQELSRLLEKTISPGEIVGPPRPDPSAIPDLTRAAAQAAGRGLADAHEKTDVRGTFSAIGAERGLGAGETVAAKFDAQLKEQQKTTKELEKLNKKAAPLTFS
jgi:hypothetical protein